MLSATAPSAIAEDRASDGAPSRDCSYLLANKVIRVFDRSPSIAHLRRRRRSQGWAMHRHRTFLEPRKSESRAKLLKSGQAPDPDAVARAPATTASLTSLRDRPAGPGRPGSPYTILLPMPSPR